MGTQPGKKLVLLSLAIIAIATGVILSPVTAVSATTTDSAVCDADDPREECSNDDNRVVDDNDNANADNDGDDDHECIDKNEHCKWWSDNGECEKNPGFMLHSCRRSCNVCNRDFFDTNDFGEPQLISPHLRASIQEVISKSISYMQQHVLIDPKYNSIRKECRNTEENCSQWALGTGCDDNPKYMKMKCAPACQSCDYILEMKEKCALDPKGTDVINTGEMDAFFERMVQLAEHSNWQPTVHSRPAKKNHVQINTANDGTTFTTSMVSCEEDVTNPCNAQIGPWVITLENFLTPLEITTLLKWGTDIGYERSQAGDKIIEARTSSQAWCKDECYDDPTVQTVRRRIQTVTGIPEIYYECLQLLSYAPGTYYEPHNDFIENSITQSHGPRLFTFFMYFNEVESGGGTRFPRLNGLTIEPKEGRVLIWPSVLDWNLYQIDLRTEHEALPVVRGEKYAANAWIHTRDYQTPFGAGCPS